MSEWKEPGCVAECDERMDELRASLEDLNVRLSDENKEDIETGERMEFTKYRSWKQRAMKKKNYLLQEIRFLKRWKAQFKDKGLIEQIESLDQKVSRLLSVQQELSQAVSLLLKEGRATC